MTAGAMMATMPPHETDLPVIELERPMLGFDGLRRFALVRLDEAGDLCRLTSVDRPDLSFLVVPPGRFFPDYAPAVGDDVLTDLEIRSADDVLLLVVLNAGESLASTTANLAAPVLVNTTSLRGGQIVLDDADLPLAAPLVS
ncbi:flagellar assembly protein FliW [Nocardioides sp. T2.26MG-1]|uniref:flagellar assembly protein FliW n=1 Tax=Nocardioides sp. T2.26MG-1 TaxID=3041166 RepID=UPI0024775A15|nr:flagellar assembly protein FliW [Nocardioides sp. T2.26MG-1]CAI9399223.1 Flagellar assembly factor FliW [Nocardioides sp. T2.26MG-1]